MLAALALAVLVLGLGLLNNSTGDRVNANAVLVNTSADVSGFARAIEAREWDFPRDFGAHPEFQTEWWYYTGNVADVNGRRFGFQFTLFRRAITPEVLDTTSEWRSNQLYMAYFTVTDVTGDQFFHEERFSRGGADLAGATVDPVYRVWLEDWEVVAQDDDATVVMLHASTDQVAIDLTLEQSKPPVLHGENGLSTKGSEPGNATYYYSLTRLLTEGTITIEGQVYSVTGATWKDHEFGTQALGANAVGWDWFGLQLDDNRELMVGQIRLNDGTTSPYSGEVLVHSDGTTIPLSADDFTMKATGSWTSPHTGAVYPSGWNVRVDLDGVALNLTLTPQIQDQELHGGGIVYWEGTVRIDGDVTGYGYAELTGYVDALTGRF
jgi:predicted secreted hydrolase